MCGLTGVFDPRANLTADRLRAVVESMTTTLQHRGPDDHGVWLDEARGVGLGHRRLSILDLSDAGHQPIRSRCGRFSLVFNGEIFNFRSLRERLSDIAFRGDGDTEVLIEHIARFGIDETLQGLNGQFAFVVWDGQSCELYLVRDRLGIKPLYYGVFDGVLLFGSELKALRAHPAFDAALDRSALREYFEHSYVPAPRSIYGGVSKLPPGHVLTISADTLHTAEPRRFWQAPFSAGTMSPDEWRPLFLQTLTDAVRLRMLSDVPLGAFLSGGIDSSLVVSLMQSQSDRPVRTFTIGFEESAWNEAPYAAAVAGHLGTDHTELIVTPAESREVIPLLPTIYDEPFADVSQIPTWLVCRLAREHVTVCLSGDGGDELFGGYDRYHHILGIDRKRRRVPRRARGFLAGMITSPLFRRLRGKSPREASLWKGVLQATDLPDLYRFLHRHWRDPGKLVSESGGEQGPAAEPFRFRTNAVFDDSDAGNLLAMTAIDTEAYLPDDILTKVDRASMHVSLEARVPLLDHRVVEVAWQLRPNARAEGAQKKQLLRDILQTHVPPGLFDRPKAGFGVPIDSWLRGPLRDWAEGLLEESRLRRDGLLHPAPIREKWEQHQRGDADWQYLLWDVLVFQAWLEATH